MLLSGFQLLRFYCNLLKFPVLKWGVNPGLCRFGSNVMWRGIIILSICSQNEGIFSSSHVIALKAKVLFIIFIYLFFSVKVGTQVLNAKVHWPRNRPQVLRLQTHCSSFFFPEYTSGEIWSTFLKPLTSLILSGITLTSEELEENGIISKLVVFTIDKIKGWDFTNSNLKNENCTL